MRIFTPATELPFAGHPTVGTALVLAHPPRRPRRRRADLRGKGRPGAAWKLLRDGGAVVGAGLTAPQPLSRGDEVPADIVAAACSSPPGDDDIETARQPALRRVMWDEIHLRRAERFSRQALTKAQPTDPDVFAQHLPIDPGATGIHLYVRDGSDGSDGSDIRARMFAPLHGVLEDPATGSANVALIGLLASLPAGAPISRCGCGSPRAPKMGRPSLIEAAAEKKAGTGRSPTYIGGRCVPMLTGTIDLTLRPEGLARS